MRKLTKELFLSGQKFRYNRSTWDRVTYSYEPPKPHETWSNGVVVKHEDGKILFHACFHSISDTDVKVYLNVMSKSIDLTFSLSELEIVEEKEVVNG